MTPMELAVNLRNKRLNEWMDSPTHSNYVALIKAECAITTLVHAEEKAKKDGRTIS